MPEITRFPQQKMSFSKKGKKWRENCVDWADKRTYEWDSNLRKSRYNKIVNYDLYNGRLHETEIQKFVNPTATVSDYISNNIEHYPIINSTLDVLIGEEMERRYEYQIRVSNMDAVSEKEKSIVEGLRSNLLNIIKNSSENEEDYLRKVQESADYFKYEYQDIREIRANYLVNHYIKELDMKIKWNQGFKDVLIAGEELYQFDIVGGEVKFEKLNPKKVRVLRNGMSTRVEDADVVVIDDYWSPGKIIDTFYDQLKPGDIDTIEQFALGEDADDMNNEDERKFYFNGNGEFTAIDGILDLTDPSGGYMGNYTDTYGNIRVLRVYWKSYRKVLRVKSYNPITGEPEYSFQSEDYIIDKELGEESESYWINEAWEGTKIGRSIYVNMRPRPVQYNRLNNPSRCHFGIIGQIYNTSDSRAVSLVDRLKPSAYLYDIIKDKLLKSIAKNYGKIVELDLAKIPDNWEVDKWLYFARKDGIAVVDSFKEGNKGAATGKLAGGFNTTGRQLDMSQGNDIQMYIQILEYIERTIDTYSGISPQRKGSISNTETVGGVERSVLQSSFITQERFGIHNNVKKRCIEALIETAKIALRGKNMKLQYISEDYANTIFDVPGDEFAECDYGVIVDDDMSAAELSQKIETLAQAGLQNQLVSFSTITHMIKGTSMSKVLRLIEKDEKDTKQRADQARQEELQSAQAIAARKDALEQEKVAVEERNNIRDNETKLIIAGSTNNESPDNSNDISLKAEKIDKDFKIASDKVQIEKDKLNETKRSNKANEQIAKSKQNNTNK